MKKILCLVIYVTFSSIAIGQHYGDLDYEALVAQILEDIPLENFKNEPTFLRVAYARSGCTGYDERDDYNDQTKETETRKHFLSPKNLARLQHEIQTALIPYFEAESMDRIIAFHGDPLFKRWPVIMPTFKTISHKKLTYFNTKKTFGYFPYKNQTVKINIQKHSLKDYIEHANHIKLEFIHQKDNKVLVTGTINTKKVHILYQHFYGKWQQVPDFKVSDITHYTANGELFIKHNNIFFEYEKIFNLQDTDIISETSILPIHQENSIPNNIISIDSIAYLNFSDIGNRKFTSENEDYKYEFFQFNQELFVLVHQYKYDGTWCFGDATFYAYSPISITNHKRIYRLFGDDNGVIIPEKNGIRVYLEKMQGNSLGIGNFSKKKQLQHHRNYDTKTLAYLANKLNFDQYYQIKEEQGKKRMYNYFGIKKLDNAYDSIAVNNFIVGINDGKLDIYNQAFYKLPFSNVRAFHLINTSTTEGSNYIPHSAQIIHNNALKTIYLSFKKEKKNGYFNSIRLHGLPVEKKDLKIVEKKDSVYVVNIHEHAPDWIIYNAKIPIKPKEIDSIYFVSNKKKMVSCTSYSLRYGLDFNEIIHVKTNNKKHYLYHTSFINRPNSLYTKAPLDEVEKYGNCIRFKEDNLYGYYGIHLKGRYKKLDQFQGFFAKFELPNGKKGWLDRNGKEYVNL